MIALRPWLAMEFEVPVIQVSHDQHRPFAAAVLEYDNIVLDKVRIKFLVDTGATRSIVTPWFEQLLVEKYKHIKFNFMPDDAIKAVQTLNGEVPVRALKRVSLRFDAVNGDPVVIPLDWIYFLRQDQSRKRDKSKAVPRPLDHALLGQDVIAQHALVTIRRAGGVITRQSERVSKWTEELRVPAALPLQTEWVD